MLLCVFLPFSDADTCLWCLESSVLRSWSWLPLFCWQGGPGAKGDQGPAGATGFQVGCHLTLQKHSRAYLFVLFCNSVGFVEFSIGNIHINISVFLGYVITLLLLILGCTWSCWSCWRGWQARRQSEYLLGCILNTFNTVRRTSDARLTHLLCSHRVSQETLVLPDLLVPR